MMEWWNSWFDCALFAFNIVYTSSAHREEGQAKFSPPKLPIQDTPLKNSQTGAHTRYKKKSWPGGVALQNSEKYRYHTRQDRMGSARTSPLLEDRAHHWCKCVKCTRLLLCCVSSRSDLIFNSSRLCFSRVLSSKWILDCCFFASRPFANLKTFSAPMHLDLEFCCCFMSTIRAVRKWCMFTNRELW